MAHRGEAGQAPENTRSAHRAVFQIEKPSTVCWRTFENGRLVRLNFGNRHGQGAGILGFDSRVLWITIQKFNDEALNSPGLLWCSPFRQNGK
jgi:hypothetical protein